MKCIPSASGLRPGSGRVRGVPAFILGGGLTGLGIVRSLGRRGIRVRLFDRRERDIAYRSRYATVSRLPSADDPAPILKHLLNEARQESERPALFFASDFFMRFVSDNREELAEVFRFACAPREAVASVLHKDRFAAFAREHSLPAPMTLAPTSEGELRNGASTLRYPAIVKPAVSDDWAHDGFSRHFGRIKAVRVGSPAELITRWLELAQLCRNLVIQEEIGGGDDLNYSYFSYRRAPGQEAAALVLRKLRICPIHAGVAALAVPVDDAEVAAVGRQTLDALGFVGMASVSCKKDPNDGSTRVYEVNGRFPIAHASFALCGVDLPHLMYRDICGFGDPAPALRTPGKKWLALALDIPAAIAYRRAGELTFGEWIRSLRDIGMIVEFAADDLNPGFFALRHLATTTYRQIVHGEPGERVL